MYYIYMYVLYIYIYIERERVGVYKLTLFKKFHQL